eukprot:GHVU01052498.1.p1 GENE.GHVU01052498.1~~GHVU01052498.1.p1  ORF type:complete len:547 (+),score=58.57 GHVU01052498.1:299-1939(+)
MTRQKVTPKQVHSHYFSSVHPRSKITKEGYQFCKCGKHIKSPSNGGYTPFMNHVKGAHPSWESVVGNPAGSDIDETLNSEESSARVQGGVSQGTLHEYRDSKAWNIFRWIQWLVMELLPLTFVNKPLTRQNTSLKPICYNTLVKWMRLLCFALERTLCGLLPQKFGIILDGWTRNGTHFVSLFAVGPTDTYCLAFSPLEDERDLGAAEHCAFIESTLEVYERDVQSILFQVADHAPVMIALASMLDVPMIGCYSHRMNLAMNRYCAEEGHNKILGKIHAVMTVMRTVKNRAQLRHQGQQLAPKAMNDTRWSTSYAMIKRYLEIRKDIVYDNEELVECALSPQENAIVDSLYTRLRELHSVTVMLQKADLNVAEARELVDASVGLEESMKAYLAEDAAIVPDESFEKAIVKLLNQQEQQLTVEEKTLLAPFKRDAPGNEASEKGNAKHKEPTFSEEILIQRRQRLEARASYVDVKWIPATSNLCERANSIAGKVLRKDRMGTSPYHLELLMFLKLNSKFWDVELVQSVITSPEGVKAEEEDDSSSDS